MSVELTDFWVMACTNESCSLKGQPYPTDSAQIECGGCNTVYTND
jgi:hypothetical protein